MTTHPLSDNVVKCRLVKKVDRLLEIINNLKSYLFEISFRFKILCCPSGLMIPSAWTNVCWLWSSWRTPAMLLKMLLRHSTMMIMRWPWSECGSCWISILKRRRPSQMRTRSCGRCSWRLRNRRAPLIVFQLLSTNSTHTPHPPYKSNTKTTPTSGIHFAAFVLETLLWVETNWVDKIFVLNGNHPKNQFQ